MALMLRSFADKIENMKKVSVIGTGMMGSTLARLLIKNGYAVTAWNRSTTKLEPLMQEGILAADSAAAAIAAVDVVVMCVHDYKAVDSILRGKEVEAAFAGKLLIQFTTGSPQDARNYADWTKKCGGTYLDG